jgi:hypothetical protein
MLVLMHMAEFMEEQTKGFVTTEDEYRVAESEAYHPRFKESNLFRGRQ